MKRLDSVADFAPYDGARIFIMDFEGTTVVVLETGMFLILDRELDPGLGQIMVTNQAVEIRPIRIEDTHEAQQLADWLVRLEYNEDARAYIREQILFSTLTTGGTS